MAAPGGFSLARVLEVNNKKGILGLLFSYDALKFFADGNIGYNKLIKGPNAGTLVGTDAVGNRYYENDDLPYGRKRWVVYADTFDYSSSSVPSEWHGWFHGINDYAPTRHSYVKPIYAVAHRQTQTGTSEAYLPKGSWSNPGKRNWKKYEAWSPVQAKS